MEMEIWNIHQMGAMRLKMLIEEHIVSVKVSFHSCQNGRVQGLHQQLISEMESRKLLGGKKKEKTKAT